MTATSTKPYLLRALYEWCSDNDYTPYIQAWVNDHTRVPRQHVQNEHIILNIGFRAIKNLLIDNEWITFQARFNGEVQNIEVPVGHVRAIFTKETGEGMKFEVEAWQPENETQSEQNKPTVNEKETTQPKKKGLKLVK